jgi:hypothetical protein
LLLYVHVGAAAPSIAALFMSKCCAARMPAFYVSVVMGIVAQVWFAALCAMGAAAPSTASVCARVQAVLQPSCSVLR